MSGGSIRRLGAAGRLVLPMELRRALDWHENDRVRITRDGETVVLTKYQERCCFCGGETRLKEYRGKLICGRCLDKLKELY